MFRDGVNWLADAATNIPEAMLRLKKRSVNGVNSGADMLGNVIDAYGKGLREAKTSNDIKFASYLKRKQAEALAEKQTEWERKFGGRQEDIAAWNKYFGTDIQ